jgi:hypothetical protein
MMVSMRGLMMGPGEWRTIISACMENQVIRSCSVVVGMFTVGRQK